MGRASLEVAVNFIDRNTDAARLPMYIEGKGKAKVGKEGGQSQSSEPYQNTRSLRDWKLAVKRLRKSWYYALCMALYSSGAQDVVWHAIAYGRRLGWKHATNSTHNSAQDRSMPKLVNPPHHTIHAVEINTPECTCIAYDGF